MHCILVFYKLLAELQMAKTQSIQSLFLGKSYLGIGYLISNANLN